MLALLAALLAFSQEQAQTPTFRTGVTSVLVDTLVLDADGNPVPDLTIDDFEIYEDGVKQTITTLDVTDWTSYVAARTSGEADLTSPDASINTYPRRFILIYNRQGARFDWLTRAKRALGSFVVESMADGDEAMVIDIGYSWDFDQEFMTTKAATIERINDLSQMVMDYPMDAFRASGDLYRNLESLGRALEQIPGRKIIVLMSNELPTFAPAGTRRTSEGFSLERAVEALNQANTTVYTIDLRGPDGRDTIAGGLSPLATETGGRFFRNAVQFTTPLRNIGRENGRYYLLSYVPTDPEMDGAYRRIEVEVSRPNVEVRARRGYFARERETLATDATPDGATPDEPDGATPDENDENGASEPDTGRDRLPARPHALPAAVEMTSYFLPTGSGSAKVPVSVALPRELLVAADRKLTLTISQDGRTLHTFEEAVNTDRYYLVENVELEPGSYLMQITLDADGEELYQASSPIHVPAGFGERFGLSSIVPVVAPDATAGIGNDVPILPTTTLPRGDDAYLLFQVFPGMDRPSRSAYLSYKVYDDGREVGAGGKNGPMELAENRPGGTPVILRIPMSDLRAGLYRIDVQVEDRSLGRRATSEIELRIN